MTLILTLIITAVITFVVTYIGVKRKVQKTLQDLKDKQQNNTLLYEQIVLPNHTVTKDDDSSHKVTIGSNSTYV